MSSRTALSYSQLARQAFSAPSAHNVSSSSSSLGAAHRAFTTSAMAQAKRRPKKRADNLVVKLIEPVNGLGLRDEVVNVNPGRMRRELLPNRQAVYLPWKRRSDLVLARELASSAAQAAAQENAGDDVLPSVTPGGGSIPIGRVEPKLAITFTCTVEGCGERSSHEFTKRSYQKGIVIVQCPGCKNRHLIADHLGWFKESTEDGKLRTIEDVLAARGESVTRARVSADGTIEYEPPSDTLALPLRPLSDVLASIAAIPDRIRIESATIPDSQGRLYGSVTLQDVRTAIEFVAASTGVDLREVEVGWEVAQDRVRETGEYTLELSAKAEGGEVAKEKRVLEVVAQQPQA